MLPLTASGTLAHAPVWGLRSRSRTFSIFSFIESVAFEKQVLFYADFLSVISDLRAHELTQVWSRGQNLGHL